jgi:hypothetical protein
VLLGLTVVLAISIGAPWSVWMVGSSELTWSYLPVGVGLPFLLILSANVLVGRYRNGAELSPAELAVILAMGLAVTGIPIFILGVMLAILSSPYYAAIPENQWERQVQPYLPSWAVPGNEGEVMRWFHEGLPSGQPLPWQAWLAPLGWWLSLLLAIYLICFCLVVLLRRQWVEHERLVFPLTEMPRLLMEDGGRRLLRDRLFWIGCGLGVALLCVDLVGYFLPGFPQLRLHRLTPLYLHPDFPPLTLVLFLPVVGFVFLASTGISFSIWFFYLVAVLQEGISNRLGYQVGGRPDPFVWGMPSLSWQAWGAFVAMVAWSLWMARGHLAAVWRHAVRGTAELDDGQEMVSYRSALVGAAAGLLYVLGWLWASGMEPRVAVLFTGTVLVVYLGITRLVVQSGVYYLGTPVVGQAFTLAVTGTRLGPSNLVALALAYTWHGDVQSIFMPAAAHGARLADLGHRPRDLARVMGLAVVVGFVVSLAFILHLCYQYGAANFRSWYFAAGQGAAKVAFDGVVYQLANPASTDWGKLGHFAFGGVLYTVLIAAQYRFSWWPLHPAGLAVAPLWMTRHIALSVALAWACKVLVLRYGGVRRYRELRPLFIGLVAGFFLAVGIGLVVDATWFLGNGHFIYNG